MNTKTCTKCKEKKLLTEMVKNKSSKEGYFPYCKTCMKANSIKFRQDNPLQQLLSGAKSSAKKRNIIFELTLEDIVIPERCKYLGIPLEFNVGKGLLPQTPSIDRVDTNKGYTRDNIQIISHKANALKSDLPLENLIHFAKQIISLHT